MPSIPFRRVAQAGVVVALAAGALGFTAYDKSLTLNVDGKTSTTHAFASTVGDVLAAKDIKVGSHDLVSPSLGSGVGDGDTIVVKYGRELTVVLDGKRQSYWTTAQTVDAALSDLGVRAASGAELSASRSTPLGRDGLTLSIVTPKKVNLVIGGKKSSTTTTASTVGELLTDAKITLGAKDKLKPGQATPITAGLKVVVNRVTSKTVTKTESIAYATTRKSTSSLYKGQTQTQTAGKTGTQVLTVQQTFVDGKKSAEKTVKSEVKTKAVNAVVLVGTKSRPATTSSGSSGSSSGSSRPSAGNTGGGGLNLANAGMWDRIARCESGGNWHINTGNGYYGGLQFLTSTWLAYGGGQFAGRADLASREQQITVANRYYAVSGLSGWGCAGAA